MNGLFDQMVPPNTDSMLKYSQLDGSLAKLNDQDEVSDGIDEDDDQKEDYVKPQQMNHSVEVNDYEENC